jgi:tripartite-type tricarboxylate transporter receptor subunit TctC
MKRTIAAAMILVLGIAVAAAQDWPAKPVKIVVPFAAGATPDIVARLVADDLQSRLKQTFIVENRPGASGNTGTDAVAKAERDGATIGVSIGGPLAINTILFAHLP